MYVSPMVNPRKENFQKRRVMNWVTKPKYSLSSELEHQMAFGEESMSNESSRETDDKEDDKSSLWIEKGTGFVHEKEL